MRDREKELREQIIEESLVSLSTTGYFDSRHEKLTLESINGIPTDPVQVAHWGIRLSAQRDLLMRLKTEADSLARDQQAAEQHGDSEDV